MVIWDVSVSPHLWLFRFSHFFFSYELISLEIPFHNVGLGVEELIVGGTVPELSKSETEAFSILLALYSGCLSILPDDRWTATRALSHVRDLIYQLRY